MRLKIVAFLCTFGCSARLTVCLCAAKHDERRTYDILQDILRVSRRRFTFHSICSVRVILITIELGCQLCSWTERKLATILILESKSSLPRLILILLNFQDVIIFIWSWGIHFNTRVKMKWGSFHPEKLHWYTIKKFSMRSIEEFTATPLSSSH